MIQTYVIYWLIQVKLQIVRFTLHHHHHHDDYCYHYNNTTIIYIYIIGCLCVWLLPNSNDKSTANRNDHDVHKPVTVCILLPGSVSSHDGPCWCLESGWWWEAREHLFHRINHTQQSKSLCEVPCHFLSRYNLSLGFTEDASYGKYQGSFQPGGTLDLEFKSTCSWEASLSRFRLRSVAAEMQWNRVHLICSKGLGNLLAHVDLTTRSHKVSVDRS